MVYNVYGILSSRILNTSHIFGLGFEFLFVRTVNGVMVLKKINSIDVELLVMHNKDLVPVDSPIIKRYLYVFLLS